MRPSHILATLSLPALLCVCGTPHHKRFATAPRQYSGAAAVGGRRPAPAAPRPRHNTEAYDHLTDNPINRDVKRFSELAIQGEEQPPYEVEITQ